MPRRHLGADGWRGFWFAAATGERLYENFTNGHALDHRVRAWRGQPGQAGVFVVEGHKCGALFGFGVDVDQGAFDDDRGIVGKVAFDFAKVMARKNLMIKDFADHRVQQLKAGKFKFIRANASFVDAHTVELLSERRPPARRVPKSSPQNAGPETGAPILTAKHFVIATGSRVAPAPLPQ